MLKREDSIMLKSLRNPASQIAFLKTQPQTKETKLLIQKLQQQL